MELVRRIDVNVLILEDLVDLIRHEFLVLVVGNAFDTVTEVLAHLLRHVDAVFLLHDEADAALAGLAVDADDVAVVLAADILRVDVEVRQRPLVRILLFLPVHALRDGILMGAGEGGEDEVTGVRLAR